jgi:hypothetical protein
MFANWITQAVFIAQPIVVEAKSNWKDDADLKKCFAIALLTEKTPFEAGCKVFGNETNKALFAAANWVNDPIVVEAKQNYTESSEKPQKLLDREELSARLLAFSEDKITFNGNLVYAAEAKDRLAALKLYADIQGFTKPPSVEINNNNKIENNFLKIKFVEPDKKEDTKIINDIEEEAEVLNLPNLKLVG